MLSPWEFALDYAFNVLSPCIHSALLAVVSLLCVIQLSIQRHAYGLTFLLFRSSNAATPLLWPKTRSQQNLIALTMEWNQPRDFGDDLVADLMSQFNCHGAKAIPQASPGQPEEPPEDSQLQKFEHVRPEVTYEPQPEYVPVSQPENSHEAQSEDQPQDALQQSATSEQGQLSESRLAAVKIPEIVNSEGYEYFPGHFEVRYVMKEDWDDEGEAWYKVRLRSGEIQTVRP